MNLEYLGDALDHWKGSLFEYLQNEGILRDFAVDPIATDRERWTQADFALYARLLRINRRQIIRHQASLSMRGRYFAEIMHKGDLFLDPDTGIATSGASPIAKYIRPREVALLLHSAADRVLAVYQHVRAQKTCTRVDSCVAAVGKEIGAAGWCSYESSMVAILFLCVDAQRTQEICNALHRLLGRHGHRRVRCSTNGGPT